VSRLPIRLRLTLIFAAAMAAVIVAVGGVLYLRLGDSLTSQIDERLTARAESLAGVAGGSAATFHGGLPAAAGGGEGFAQVVAADGRVLAATAGFERQMLLPAGRSAATGDLRFEREVVEPDGDVDPARLLATPVPGSGRLLLVGESVTDRRDALRGLLTQLWILGPIALVLSSILGFLVSGAALRPVEAMRRRASEIGADTPEGRLPLPEARDEIHRLGETLNAMLERLDEGLRRERRFVADASHELRTPLALLKIELELATRRPRTAAELDAALRSASEEVDRLVRLSEDMLVLATVDDGALPLRPDRVEVGAVVCAVAARFTAKARAAGRDLDVDASEGLVIVADRLRLEQALGNLVDNALRHGAGTIRLAARRDGDTVVVSVGDRGPGFAAELIPRAFERFSRGDAARSDAAAGLGLAIVDAIARAHGGHAAVRNGADAGAEVALTLPVDAAAG
jgi:heavy metal sensor kinase